MPDLSDAGGSSGEIRVQPRALRFHVGPHQKDSVQHVYVQNASTARAYAFKVKTTSPRSYSVKPSSGILWQGEEEQVTITLRGHKAAGGGADVLDDDRFKIFLLPLNDRAEPSAIPADRRGFLAALWEQHGSSAVVCKIKSTIAWGSPPMHSFCAIPEEAGAPTPPKADRRGADLPPARADWSTAGPPGQPPRAGSARGGGFHDDVDALSSSRVGLRQRHGYILAL